MNAGSQARFSSAAAAPLLAVALFTLGSALADEVKTVPSEKILTGQIAASRRYSSQVEIPRQGHLPLHASLALDSWRLSSRDKQVEVPPQEFYVAELVNGSVETVIDGHSEQRRAGDQWAVKRGERMRVRITGKRQENALLQVFSVRITEK